ncbi:MAG: hypothetical protein FJ271_28085 [Planctomycetes bacterium]|nr:hypothetical protein [Planctomycetota bacterium]
MQKSILTAGLALLLSAWFCEPAQAWRNAKFGVGLNWSHQAGGNNLLWGFFRNGQPPAPTPPPHPGFMPGGPGYGPYGPAPFPGFAPGFGGGAPVPMIEGTGQAESVPSFHPVSFPGQYIPATDFSDGYYR